MVQYISSCGGLRGYVANIFFFFFWAAYSYGICTDMHRGFAEGEPGC